VLDTGPGRLPARVICLPAARHRASPAPVPSAHGPPPGSACRTARISAAGSGEIAAPRCRGRWPGSRDGTEQETPN